MTDRRKHPRFSFYVRRAQPYGTWRYDLMSTPDHRGPMTQEFSNQHVPAIGDLIFLPGGVYRIIDRSWMYPAFGSAAWPLADAEPTVGPIVTFLLDQAPGMFVNEHTDPEENQ